MEEWKQGYRKNRKEEVILSRLRIGYARTTHSDFLEAKQQPDQKNTVKYIIIECTDLAHIRETFLLYRGKEKIHSEIELVI